MTITCDDYPHLLELMHHDKKNTGSDINFTLLGASATYASTRRPQKRKSKRRLTSIGSHSHALGFVPGRLPCLGERQAVYRQYTAGHPILGQVKAAKSQHVPDSFRLGEQYDLLAEFFVWSLRNHIRYVQMGTQQAFHLLYLYLDASRADDVVLAAQDTESPGGTGGG